MLAVDPHVDLADAIPLPLGDVVDEVELSRRLEKPRIGPDVGEHEAPAAVDVADEVQIGVHLGLVEGLAALELEVPLEELRLELAVADEGDVPHGVPRPLVDHEGEVRPVPHALVHHLHLAAHPGLEEPEAPVVGRELLDVLVDDVAVDVAADHPEDAGLRFDLGEQPGVAGDGVADEGRPQRLPPPALVDEEHRSLVLGPATLDRGHAGGVVALLVIVRLDAAAGLLDDVGVHRVAHVDLRLLPQRAGGDPLVADVLDVAEHRPLDHLEDDDDSLRHPDVLRVHVDELLRAVERADVLLDRAGVENLAGPGHELRQLRDVGGVIALDADLDDAVGAGRVGGRDGPRGAGRREGERHGQADAEAGHGRCG